ncbi:MAG: glycosyltransferase family 2 protein, partial [Thermoplasmata archaeon]|nr:glycosyltransferase family 2 protein [Thermoplasmata archaeon]
MEVRTSEATAGPMPRGSDSPRLTVVITAHQRREFLRDAVESVVRQRSESLPIQIVVVKDFVEESLESFLRDSGILTLYPEQDSLGHWLTQMLPHAAAPVLAFLDDDVLFLPGKLEAIDHQFQQRPRCGFYRNAILRAHGRSSPARTLPTVPPTGVWWVDDAAK